MAEKKFAPAAERNKHAILEILQLYIKPKYNILEIGSGTGQHISFFAEKFPDNNWQPSDFLNNHSSIITWSAHIDNIKSPIELDVSNNAHTNNIITHQYNIIFSANTTHIMSWSNVQSMFELISMIKAPNGLFILYGPFNINNQYTSQSNKDFDQSLKSNNPNMGLRDLSDLKKLAIKNNLKLKTTHQMPANNMILVFE